MALLAPYGLARSALFKLDAEHAHDLTINTLSCTPASVIRATMRPKVASRPVELMGLHFPNPVGLAAGLDKNGVCADAFLSMGFGFVEVGTVTPRPQPGNPRPRLFRLTEHGAIINRMGFNNRGVDALVAAARKRRQSGILGINIGKNKDTPNDKALDDYLYCLNKAYDVADYITINISSPNTPGLRDLQQEEELDHLLQSLKQRQLELANLTGRYVPLTVKIAPDQSAKDLQTVAAQLKRHDIDGVIATNTTIDKSAVAGHQHADEAGGLSGEPLTKRATDCVKVLRQSLGPSFPIIAAGGIHDGMSAQEKQQAGADLVQIYTGFIYHGPQLIADAAEIWSTGE